MTRHCHHCGREYLLAGQPGRLEACEKCGSDLKVCLNCVHYDLKSAYQCRERRADPVSEKHMANYCEYFEMVKRPWNGPDAVNTREQQARDSLKKLLGD